VGGEEEDKGEDDERHLHPVLHAGEVPLHRHAGEYIKLV